VLTPAAEELTGLIHGGSAPREVPRRPVIANTAEEDRAARGPELEDFEKYVARRHTALLRTAYLLTGDSYTAEDLVQTALALAWLAWPRIREPAGVDTYVRRILVNTQRSFWRRRRVQELLVRDVPERDSGIGATSELHQVLWAALAELPRQQRATLVLRYYEDLSNSEIADVLGVSAGTVKSNASRALAALRQRASVPVDRTQTRLTGYA
jgi:RNA polymerase sigma-70 factor (sigma-E family)